MTIVLKFNEVYLEWETVLATKKIGLPLAEFCAFLFAEYREQKTNSSAGKSHAK